MNFFIKIFSFLISRFSLKKLDFHFISDKYDQRLLNLHQRVLTISATDSSIDFLQK